MSYELTIAGRTIEIGKPEDLPLGTTFEVTDILDPSKAKGSRSNSIKFPMTQSNAELGTYDMAEPLKDRDEMPFVLGNGSGTIWKGVAVPITTEKQGAEWSLFGESASWFGRVKDRKLSDLDLGVSLAHNVGNVTDSWDLAEEKALLFALADYGNLGDKAPTYDVNLKYVLPSVNLKWICDRLFAALGYEVQYRGGVGAHLRKMFFLFNRKLEDIIPIASILNEQAATFDKTVPTTYSPGLGATMQSIVFPTVVSDPGSTFVSPGRYSPGFDERVTVNLKLTTTNSEAGQVQFKMYVFDPTNGIPAGSTVHWVKLQGGEGTVTRDFSFEGTNLIAGYEYGIGIQWLTGSFDVNRARFEVVPEFITWQEDLIVNVNSLVPDMKQAEFISGILATFGAIPITDPDRSTVTIIPERDWRLPPEEALDWTAKLDVSKVSSAKVRQSIPKFHEFRCVEDSDDTLSLQFIEANRRGLGDHDHTVRDKNANGTQEVKVPWAATHTGTAMGSLRVPQLLKDGETDPDAVNYGWKPRVVYFGGMQAAEWVLDGTTLEELPDVYFVKPGSSYADLSLSFSTNGGSYGEDIGLVDRYHHDRLNAVEYSRFLSADLFLTDEDIRTLDFARPVLLRVAGTVSAYYLTKVNEYLWGRGVSTPCELVEAVAHLPNQYSTKPVTSTRPRIQPRK